MARFKLTEPPIKLSENDVEKQCTDLLKVRGYRPIRLNSGKFRTVDNRWITIGEVGMPDYVIPAFFVEVKRPGKHISPEQEKKIFELTRGWNLPVAVVDSMEALNEFLNNLKR